MRIVAETKRLILKEFSIDEAQYLYNLNADSEVIKYTGDSTFKDLQEAACLLSNYDHYVKYGSNFTF